MSRLLQVCPNDYPPFRDLCSFYQQAANKIDLACTTVFLKPSNKTPLSEGKVYYLKKNEKLEQVLGRENIAPEFILSHRYRGWQAVCSAKIKSQRHINIAHGFGAFRTFRRKMRFRLFAGNTELAAVSQAVAEDLQQATGHTAMVMPNAVDLPALDAKRLSREAARQTLGLPQDGHVIGVVGRLHWWKQPTLALEGFAQAKLPNSHICFLGSGDEAENLAKLDQQLNTQAKLCGFVEDAPIYFNAFDQLLVTSNHKEAFGMITIEALSAGVPVVSSKQKALQEVLGDLATYIDPLTVVGVAAALKADQKCDFEVMRERVATHFSVDVLGRRLSELFDTKP